MKKLILMLAAATVVAATSIVLLQDEVEVVVEALSPDELLELGWTTHPSSGLDVVGNGELVYLSGRDATDTLTVTGYDWLLLRPDGSEALLDSVGTMWNTFRPDIPGEYIVELTLQTTELGPVGPGSVTIVSADYVGVGVVGGQSPDFTKGQCAACHSGNTTQWMDTGHATMFELAIDGLKSDHYNGACVECHTVGYNEEVTAVNGGFDDVATDLGWLFPDTLIAGNWQDIVDNYPDLAAVSNIQCENCHGPGSLHKGDATKIALTVAAGVCGRCHEEGPYHVKNTQWKNSGHGSGGTWANQGVREIDLGEPDFRSECAYCHSPVGFIQRTDPASEALDRIGLTGEPLTCAACHDPHSVENEHQLRLPDQVQLASGPVLNFGGNGRLCMSCHQDRRAGGGEAYAANPTSTFRGPHHSNQTDLLAGASEAVVTFGRVLPNSTHKDVVADACVTCHMADNGRDDLGAHSWAMSTMEIVGTDTLHYDNVASCVNCHGPITSFDDIIARADHDGDGDVEPVKAEVEGLLHDLAMLLPPFGLPEVDSRAPEWGVPENTLLRKAAWNYLFVDYDHSHGIHNYQFAVALLQVSIQALEWGVLDPGSVLGVADVPMDQGKQVGVAWNRFGGDGVSDTPLQTYYVWRRVDGMGTPGKTQSEPDFTSFDVVPGDAEKVALGASVAADGDYWTVVASQPAAGQDMYAAVAPTLWDTTPGDTVYSVFRVSGHSFDSQIFVVSLPDSGYSVDNLAPTAPTGLVAADASTQIELAWDEPVDADFNYFAVYRSTEMNFDPSLMQPIATTTSNAYADADVVVGTTYYYRVTATDFGKNESDPSAVSQSSVATEATGEIPTAFELYQNYPNPFNPTTTITFDVPVDSDVTIAVYDLLGRQVRLLTNGTIPAGTHRLSMRANDMSSGLYVIRMEAGEKVFQRTMMLVK